MSDQPAARDTTRLVVALMTSLAAVAVGLVASAGEIFEPMFPGPWWLFIVIGLAYALCERFMFDVEFRRESMSFSMSEVPTVFALAFLGPVAAVSVRVLATSISILMRSKPPLMKVAFNSALFAFESALAFALVRRIVGPGIPDPGQFLAAAALGTTVATIVGVLMVWTVISIFEGKFVDKVRAEIPSSVFVAVVGALSAAAAVAPALIGLRHAWISIVPVACAWLVMRNHGELTRVHRNLDDLHGFAGVIGRALDLDVIAPSALDEIGRLVRAEHVTLELDDGASGIRSWHRGRLLDSAAIGETPDLSVGFTSCDQFSVPVAADGASIGHLLIAGCFQKSRGFGEDDVRRAADLADQLAVSMRNGLLHASMEWAALHDALTDDANRTAFETGLEEAISTLPRDTLAVIVLDLNQFKEVNDTLGHHVGDQVLIEFSRRVRSVLDGVDLLARFGGDEFAILLRRPTRCEIRAVAEAILTESYQPLELDGCDAVVTASIGIAFVGDGDRDASGVLRHADIAMYAAKNQRIGIETYREEIDRRTPARLSLLGDLRAALESDDVDVHYQPKIDLTTATVTGAEALVRWTHPDRGPIPPDDFIGVAEESGLIRLVTDLVLRRSIRQARLWQDAGYDLDVAVNLSALDLHDDQLASRVGALLAEVGLDPSKLTLEITESALMVDSERTMSTIERLDLLGVRLSLDDFGTGYSSLSYLRYLPVSELKIDRSFVRELLVNTHDDVIVRSTIDLGHNLGLRVVAEGIENTRVCDKLAALGCDSGQGYGIARPLAPASFDLWLENSGHEVEMLPSRRPVGSDQGSPNLALVARS